MIQILQHQPLPNVRTVDQRVGDAGRFRDEFAGELLFVRVADRVEKVAGGGAFDLLVEMDGVLAAVSLDDFGGGVHVGILVGYYYRIGSGISVN